MRVFSLPNIFPLFIMLLISGCASQPTQEDLMHADYGDIMTPEECISVAESTIRSQLKDPMSAEFTGEMDCMKEGAGAVPLLFMGKKYGYIQTGQVNAKNSFGGRVGFRNFKVLMKNGKAVRSCIANEYGTCIPIRN